jgi:hypothetical protein
MRDPVPVEHEQQHESASPVEMPAPAVSLLPGRKITEPDKQFVTDIAKCVRSGVRPLVAAQWLGVGRKQWKLWRQRTGGLYDELRDAVRSATAHLEVKLMADLAKKSPGAALKGLRRIADDEPEPESRPYHQHGLHTVKRALPFLLERVNDTAIPDADLSPVEHAARQWRESVISDLGGRDAITTIKLALLDACVGSWIVLSSVDAYLFEMAAADGLVSRKYRKLHAVVEQRARLADSLTKQLLALGLERAAPKLASLDEYVRERYGDGNADAPPAADPARMTETE